MSNIRIGADTHFGHDKNKYGLGGIIQHAKRINPLTGELFTTIEEHDEFMLAAWNKDATSKTITYIAGDFAWDRHAYYINALKGKKILIKGSHDKMPQVALRNFTEVHNGMLIRTICGVPFVITHCAMLVWEGSRYNAINAHGHSHMRLPEYPTVRRTDVGVDGSINYAPWDIEFIIYKMSLKLKPEHSRGPEALDEEVIKNRTNNIKLYNQWKLNENVGSINADQGIVNSIT